MSAWSRKGHVVARPAGAAALVLIAFSPINVPASAQDTDAASQPASQPATRPVEVDHETLLEIVSREPLHKPELMRADGKPLTDEDRAELKKADEHISSADAAKAAGKWADAARDAKAAAEIRSKVLGDKNHLTISADIASRIGQQVASLSDEARAKYTAAIADRDQARALQEDGRFEAALEKIQTALADLTAVLNENHADVGLAQLRLGSIFTDMARLTEAETAFAKARQILERSYGDQHPETARLYDRLGWLRIYQLSTGENTRPRLQEAVAILAKAVKIFQETLGENVDDAEALDNLGTALLYAGNPLEAARAKLRALYIRETLLGPNHKDTGVSLSNLAWLYSRMGKPEPVIPLRTRALRIFESGLPKGHPYPSMVRNDLANDYINQNQHDEAIELLEAAIVLDADRLAALEADAIVRKRVLGEAYLQVGKIEEGRRQLAEVYELSLAVYQKGFVDSAHNLLSRLSGAYQLHRMYDDYCRVQQKLVEWDDARRGSDDSLAIVQRAVRLASVLREVGRHAEAKAIFERVIPRAQKLGEPALIELVGALVQMSRACESLGEYRNATRIADDAARVAEAKLGRQSGLTAFAMMWLGRMNSLEKHNELAEFSLNDALSILKGFKNEDLSAELQMIQQLAEHYLRKGDREKALQYFRDGLAICRKVEPQLSNSYVDASIAAMLRGLLKASDAGGATPSERTEWSAEFKQRLEKLKLRHALSAEEKAWLAELAA